MATVDDFTVDELKIKLRNAHNAGDKNAASRFAQMIRVKADVPRKPVGQTIPLVEGEDFVPDVTDSQMVDPSQQEQPSRGVIDVAQGVGETIANIPAAVPVGIQYLQGSIEGMFKSLVDEGFTPQDAERMAIDRASDAAKTYMRTPTSQTGQDIAQGMEKLTSQLPPILGVAQTQLPARAMSQSARAVQDVAPDLQQRAMDMPQDVAKKASNVAKTVQDYETPRKAAIREALERTMGEGTEIDKASAGFEIAPTGKIIKNPLEQAALSQGIDEGFTSALKTTNKTERVLLNKMLDIIERDKIMGDIVFSHDNRPSDVLGDVLLSRYKEVKAINRGAGDEIDKVANSLKGKPIDISRAVLDFHDALEAKGIKLELKEKTGKFVANFEDSGLPPSDRGAIKEVVRQMNLQGEGGVDAFTAHTMKRKIDNSITYGKTSTAMSSDGQKILRDFRRAIDGSLDNTYKAYDKANLRYSETINALNDLQDVLPNRIDLDAANAEKALGTNLRRMASAAVSRQELVNSLEALEVTAKKYAGNGKLLLEGEGGSMPDIKKLNAILLKLEERFKVAPPAGHSASVAKGVGMAAEAKVNPVMAGVKAGAAGIDKVKGVTDEKALKALRELLKEGKKK